MAYSTHIVVDLGFGDAGKGTTVDALARRCSAPPIVVRHNGGAQAGHNVVTSDGRQHVFSQFGAGTFVPDAGTLLSKHFVMHPGGLMAEHDHLVSLGVTDALKRLMVDERALVITPFHQAMNRLREVARGDAGRHGTCGLGVGETVGDSVDEEWEHSLRAGHLRDPRYLRWKLHCVRNRKLEQVEPLLGAIDPADKNLVTLRDPGVIERTAELFESIGKQLWIVSQFEVDTLLRRTKHLIFEGAQGVLLDEWHGFHPHTTWSTTTSANADAMIFESGRKGPVTRLGVVRAYATRHGQGPFPTEDARLTEVLGDAHNTDGGWQGRFRVGWFDVPLTQYALGCSPGISALVVTCLDRLNGAVADWKICPAYSSGSFLSSQPADLQKWPRARLAHQEVVTRLLSKVTPTLIPVSSEPNAYAAVLSGFFDLPIAMMSFGPTAEEKRWL